MSIIVDCWSSDIFGKVVRLKKDVTPDRDKTSIDLNENMDSLVPALKISDMPTGWICGQTARDFIKMKTGMDGSMNVQESEKFNTPKFFCQSDSDMGKSKNGCNNHGIIAAVSVFPIYLGKSYGPKPASCGTLENY